MNLHPIEVIPLTPTTAYLAGAIIGDGHISNAKKSKNAVSHRISIQVADRDYAELILKKIKELVLTTTTIKVCQRPNRQPLYTVSVTNKSLYHFLVYSLRIPAGAKSRSVVVPERVKLASDEIKQCFLAGIFDTDGGKRGGTIGLTSASLKLVCDIQDLLLQFDILSTFDVWWNRKYERFYYGLRLRRQSIDTFLRNVPFLDFAKFLPFAAMPEWPNGLENDHASFGQA